MTQQTYIKTGDQPNLNCSANAVQQSTMQWTILEPNPCARRPCKNGGTCKATWNGKFDCECQKKWTGKTCGGSDLSH